MANSKHYLPLIAMLLLFAYGCDGDGLNPDTYQEPGFSGTIIFTGTIPPPDSLYELRIVAVPYFPVDSTFAALFEKIVTKGIIPFSENLKEKAVPLSMTDYRFSVKPQTYYYVAVVQQFGPNPLLHWRVVSVFGYTASHPFPSVVHVTDGEITGDIDFAVDFYDVPVQPFKVP